ncbi:putative membrane protein [[Actinomadura] parvosata subsp. kistnae]|uniref:Acyltransferase n=1 Tax=[Actinomadura] parvosata subsp. kistnae TaxID=1909395 RepID=A0A1U9ZS53_9ACTN|nr:acyltransferase [Nonomuraea sp. ATCC 55076]AQZ60774.1 acyltransferase [Nonomuraea sp. ATCC 55076]SPL90599.1 putative membrane protein [Actinomadura parvosata subsp. kistnae]
MTVLLDRPVAAPVAPAAPEAPAAARDPFIDLLRVVGMALIVFQHWTIPVLDYDGDRLTTGNALATPGVWVVTWLSQVMPLVFFAGGAANAIGFARSSRPAPAWLAVRLRRLAWPLLPLAAVWIPLPHILLTLGVPAQPLEVGAKLTGQLLWFLAVYLIAVTATPYALRLHQRHGWRVPVALAAGAVLTDVARFSTGVDAVGYLNVIFVWMAVHQLGFFYAEGRLRGAWALALGGFGAAALLVAYGPYPGSMIGLPGAEVSNMAPPTLAMLAVGLGQVGLAVTLRPALVRLPARRLLDWAGPRIMTMYLWHMPALFAVTGVVVVLLGVDTPRPGGILWFLGWPVWFGLLCLVMWPLLKGFARFETPPSLPYGTAGWGGMLAAAGLVGAGVLTLTVGGFAPGGGPFLAVLALLGGLLLTAPRLASR